ncbi:uncharacterized protein [Procambarus clarkii]|uniref:uncharacterized protein n=1 Tax=Procambarus clarkii TaxID=6728 RepID=UPI003742B931
MCLRSDIPSSVWLLGYYIWVYYARQPRTCFRCGLLGHQAAGCSGAAVAPVNLFQEEDFPPLPVGVDSVGEDVDVLLADAAPPASPGGPPDDAAPPPGVTVPSADLPAPVTVPAAPVGLPDGLCKLSTSSSSSSPAAAAGPAPSPGVTAVLGAGGAVEHPVVCGPSPPVVEAAAVLRPASVHLACEARGSGSASGSEDGRPEPKHS